jgi:hypothetical protein
MGQMPHGKVIYLNALPCLLVFLRPLNYSGYNLFWFVYPVL